jgi:dTMP kinase
MSRGLFLVLEGGEAAGKSTQARLLARWLAARGTPHLLTREPGGTPLGEQVRTLLLDSAEVPARAELFLMLAARAALLEQVVEPALAAGVVVVADRFDLSTLAYQGGGRGLPLAGIRQCNALATGGRRPDATILLHLDPAEGVRRRVRGGREADRIERAGATFHERVGAAYALLARSETDILVVDGSAAVEAVHHEVLDILRLRFPETFGGAAG